MSEIAERLESQSTGEPVSPAQTLPGDLLGNLELRVQRLVGRHREAHEESRDLREQLADRDQLIRELSGKLEGLEKLRAEAATRVESLIEQVDRLARVRA